MHGRARLAYATYPECVYRKNRQSCYVILMINFTRLVRLIEPLRLIDMMNQYYLGKFHGGIRQRIEVAQ